MALSGSVSTENYDGRYYKLSWEATQDVSTNKSTISWTLSCHGGDVNWYAERTLKVVIDGEEVYVKTSRVTRYKGIIETGTKTLTHNSDGSRSFSVSVKAAVYTSTVNCTGSGTFTLDNIPRASSISSAANMTLGNNCSIKWTPKSSNFKYKIELSLGSWNFTSDYISPGNTKEQTYSRQLTGTETKNSTTLYKQLPDAESGQMTATLITYNSSNTKIGENSKTFTVYIPSSVQPTAGTITLDPADITIRDTKYDYLVQSKNKLVIRTYGWSAGDGSSIKSYKFSGPGVSEEKTSSYTTVSNVSTSGQLTYTVTAVDGRGRTISTTQTIYSYPYSSPRFKKFTPVRVSTDQTKIKCNYKVNVASVGGTNIFHVSITITNKITGEKTTKARTYQPLPENDFDDTNNHFEFEGLDPNATYTIYAELRDSLGSKDSTSTYTIFGSERIFNVRPDGSGIAFGKMAETSNLFDCKWDANFRGNLSVQDKTVVNVDMLVDMVYPVGSIYMSVNNVSPATFLGGTWEQLKDRFLLGAGSTYAAGAMGGEATHTLTLDEIPSHRHKMVANWSDGTGSSEAYMYTSDRGTQNRYTDYQGGGKAHNNMPPYLAVYMWKRTK